MKKIDVTQTVMKNIAVMEKRRITSYRRKLLIVFSCLALLFVGVITVTFKILSDQQTFDLLTVFSEDREIIAEFWQDTVMSMFQELPLPELAFGGIVLCTVFVIVAVTRRKRDIVSRKEKELKRYMKEEKK